MSYTLEEWKKLSKEEQKQAGFSQMPTALRYTLLAFFAFVVIFCIAIFSSDKKPKKEKQLSRQELVEKQFNGWDGSHINLTTTLKSSMNDPESYEHVKTNYWDFGDSIVIKTTIRGKNGFGAKILKSYRAVTDIDGNIFSLTEQ